MLEPDRDVQEGLKALGRPGSPWPVDGRDRILTEVRRRQRRRMAVSGAMAAGSVAAVIGGVFLTGASVPRTIEAPVTTTTPTTARTPSPTPPLDELTGKAVGLALGLTPDLEGDDVGKCSGLYAEYAENGAGFCLAGVTDDPVREVVLARQITGYAPTDVVKSWAAAWVEYDNHDGPLAERMDLAQRLNHLSGRLAAQGRAEQN